MSIYSLLFLFLYKPLLLNVLRVSNLFLLRWLALVLYFFPIIPCPQLLIGLIFCICNMPWWPPLTFKIFILLSKLCHYSHQCSEIGKQKSVTWAASDKPDSCKQVPFFSFHHLEKEIVIASWPCMYAILHTVLWRRKHKFKQNAPNFPTIFSICLIAAAS